MTECIEISKITLYTEYVLAPVSAYVLSIVFFAWVICIIGKIIYKKV